MSTMHVNDGTVRRIASEWHGGQSSPLYALASSGAILTDVAREILEDLETAEDAGVADLLEVTAYVAAHGERGPVPGWAAGWEDDAGEDAAGRLEEACTALEALMADRGRTAPTDAGWTPADLVRAVRDMLEEDAHDPDVAPNGTCDECGAAIPDAEPGDVRRCPVSREHDPYSDRWNNGGDPIHGGPVTPIGGWQSCRYVLEGTDTDGTAFWRCTVHDAVSIGNEVSCEHAGEEVYRILYMGETLEEAAFYGEREAVAWRNGLAARIMAGELPDLLEADDFEDEDACRLALTLYHVEEPEREDGGTLHYVEYGGEPATALEEDYADPRCPSCGHRALTPGEITGGEVLEDGQIVGDSSARCRECGWSGTVQWHYVMDEDAEPEPGEWAVSGGDPTGAGEVDMVVNLTADDAMRVRARRGEGAVVHVADEDGELHEVTVPATWDPVAALAAVDVAALAADHLEAEAVHVDGWPWSDSLYVATGEECPLCGHAATVTGSSGECEDCGHEWEPDDPDAGWPMMNYAYPADGIDTDAAALLTWLPLTIVAVDADGYDRLEEGTYLALTGGGMDFSWEIAEAYVLLGYLPPVTYARLPGMAGRGTTDGGGQPCEPSARDRIIMAACRRSLEEYADRLERRAVGARADAARLAGEAR